MGLPTPESIVAFVGGAASVGGVWLKGRGSREAKFNERYDLRLRELEAEVEQCRRERPHVLILTMSVRMLATEMQGSDPRNPILKQVASALGALPIEDKGFDALMEQLNAIPGTRELNP